MREQVPDDQAADDGSALLPVSLRPGAVGVRRRTLGRSRDRRGLSHRAPPRLGRGARARARREPGLAVEGLGRRQPRDVPAADRRTHAPGQRRRQARRARSGAATTTSRPRSAPTASCSPSSRAGICSASTSSSATRRPARSSRSSADRRAIRISTRSASSIRRATGRRTAASSRSSSTPTATNEIAILDTKSTNVERRIKLPGIGAVSSRLLVAGRQDARVLRAGRRHQRSLSARPRERNDQAAHQRPVRRHPADVVARRQDDRVRDRPRAAD